MSRLSFRENNAREQFRKIVFWQNMASHHQAETLQALAQKGYDIVWCVNELLLANRAQTGWTAAKVTGVKIEIVGCRSASEIRQLVDPRDLHIFSPRDTTAGAILLHEVLMSRIRYALLGEKPKGIGLKRAYSRAAYTLLAHILPPPEFFLAMGDAGADFYRSVGFENVQPFWYTVPSSNNEIIERSNTPPSYRFIIVSRLISIKRIDVVLNAFSKLDHRKWSLQIVGDGPEKVILENRAYTLGISSNVVFEGALPANEARRRINGADTLILSSELEGWGAVVNESIAEGTRFIVSDACGASCLAGLSSKCTVFETNNENVLLDELRRHIGMGPVSRGERSSRRDIHQKISGEAAASYIGKLLQGYIPRAPWSSAAIYNG